MQHELFEFLKRANEDIEREYDRISWRVNEDPGTAGDQGEENWKKILKLWLPSNFEVITKGRILGINGKASPQLDVIVLSPDYPKQLLDCKLYLAGGVVAAFECKITLRRNHIQKLMENSKFIRELQIKDYGSIKKDLKSNIFYGLLAHSHEWKRPNSKPKDNIRNSIKEYDKKIIKHPVEMPNVLCVANVSTWHASKLIVPPQPDVKLHHYFLGSGYIEDYAENEIYTPVGAMIFCLLEHLSWEYSSLRSIVRYMQALNIIGGGQGKMRSWPLDILSEETRKNMCKFKNGGLWDEWSMFVR